MQRILPHVRSNAVAYLALFVALGGTSAWAAGQIGSGDIKDDSVKSRDVANDALTGDDVDEASLVLPPGSEVAQASGRVPLDDGGEPGGQKATILESDTGIVLQGVCDETNEGVVATVRVGSALQSSVISTDGFDETSSNSVPVILDVAAGGAAQEQATFSVVEKNGRTLQGVAYAAVRNQDHDCVFSVSLLEAIGN
jgi:hypothetical protein